MRLYTKPSGVWAVDFDCPVTGSRRRVSTGLRDKAEARKKARDIVLGLDGKATPPAATPQAPKDIPRFTMDDLFHRCELTVWSPRECRSQATVKSNLKVLREVQIDTPSGVQRFASLAPTEVSYSRLEALSQALLARGYAPGTVKRKMDMVSRSLSMAAKWEVIVAKPASPTFKVNNSRDRIITAAEEAALFEAAAERMRREPTRDWRRMTAIMRVLMDVGCRLGEAVNIRLDDIETVQRVTPDGEVVEQHVVHFRRYETKSEKPRTIPLTPAVVEWLPYLRMNAIGDRLFPMKAATVWYMFDNLRQDLAQQGMDVGDVVLHTFRHTCLTRLAKRLPIHIVSKWAGHADIKITASVYTHLDTSDLMAGLDVLA